MVALVYYYTIRPDSRNEYCFQNVAVECVPGFMVNSIPPQFWMYMLKSVENFGWHGYVIIINQLLSAKKLADCTKGGFGGKLKE